ncbi:nucleotidyl transferase AbiEii/AbiGii toxin family protein [Arcanobacterium bovis]|uniref:nucleotidyl transferase AbiEii/AbiGii toxin family protein n=1 Tax=Arcanobacterium bovis TaxID=2529275 RepID=UPI001F4F3722|nr:nucleotidyl transferase AbiEii/AbiGii toxin family protein [Arcanobacterium bovis]
MVYKSAAALEMAVKATALTSVQDTGRVISSFYFHRFLCRIFNDGNDSFILKGGQSLLARTADARMTRDIDLLGIQDDLDAALETLVGLAETDLGDFLTFEFVSAHPIKMDDEYRSGLAVKFIPVLGVKRMQLISIDLVVDALSLETAELVTPADRIEIDGLVTCDYLVYAVENALADKLCALTEITMDDPHRV